MIAVLLNRSANAGVVGVGALPRTGRGRGVGGGRLQKKKKLKTT